MKIKILVSSVCFFILTVCISLLLSAACSLVNMLDDDRTRMEALYKEQPNHLDILVVGPSSSFCSWSPIYAWNKYGITSHSFTFGHFPISAYKYAVKEVLKKQKPKVIIIYTDAINNNIFNHDEYLLYHKFLLYMPVSKNKFDMINAICKECKLNLKARLELYFPIIRYHSQWKNLFNYKNIKTFDKCVVNFFVFFKKGEKNFLQRHANAEIPQDYRYDFIKEKTVLINDLFQYLQKTGSQVLIINFPNLHFSDSEEEYINNIFRNRLLFQMAQDRGFSCYNFADFDLVKKLNIQPEEYFDQNHFNYTGTYKFTKYLSELLIDKYHLEDKRKNPSYSSWNNAYKQHLDFVKEQFNIDIEKEFKGIDKQK